MDTQEARKNLEFLANERNMIAPAFLKHILKYLKALKTKLRGNRKLICDLMQSLTSCCHKVDISEQGIVVFSNFMSDLGQECAVIPRLQKDRVVALCVFLV